MRLSFYLRAPRAAQTSVERPALLLYVLLLTAASLWLAGCGGEETPPAPTVDVATPAPTATATPAPLEQIPTVTPPTAAAAATTDMTTAVTSPLSATPTQSVPPLVEDSECNIEYDLDLAGYPDLKSTMGCALSDASNDPVAIDEFGTGPDFNRFMLWFSDTKDIYVLFQDQTWQAYKDTWDESQPEFTCNPLNVPPSSPPLPRRGFGKLWCTVDGLQKQLGMVEREERLCQHTVVQRFEQGRLLACFEDATIRYFHLRDDGSWDLITVR